MNEERTVELVRDSCGCTERQAREYLADEVRHLRDLYAAGDLRHGDLMEACRSLGLETDYTLYFAERLLY